MPTAVWSVMRPPQKSPHGKNLLDKLLDCGRARVGTWVSGSVPEWERGALSSADPIMGGVGSNDIAGPRTHHPLERIRPKLADSQTRSHHTPHTRGT